METVALKPRIVVMYEGRDVSGDFAPILTGISYKEYLDGKAAEVEINLSDKEGLFLADWYPDVADRLQVLIGYEGSKLLDSGTFWVDEVNLGGGRSGDTCSIRALSLRASDIQAQVEKKNYAKRSIQDIVSEVAKKIGCRPMGDLSGTWQGVQRETNLQFLYRLAKETGRILKVEGEELIFYKISSIASSPSLTIDRSDVISYDIKDVAVGRISKCTVKWWDTKKKTLISGSHDSGIKGGGTMVKWDEVEDNTKAAEKAKDYVTERNKGGLEFSINLVGDVRLRSGVTVKVTSFGRFDGQYYISEVTHNISRSGYSVSVTLQKPQKK